MKLAVASKCGACGGQVRSRALRRDGPGRSASRWSRGTRRHGTQYSGECGTALRAQGLQVGDVERTRLVPAPPKTGGGFGAKGRSYVERFDVQGCETIPGSASGQVISPIVVTKIVESLAIGHFQTLSGDTSDVPRSKEMKDLDLTFMLSRITFSFCDLPARGDAVEAETCFKPQKVSFKRDFAVRNKTSGKLAAAATSTYVLVNVKTRKLFIAPKEMIDLYKDTSTKDTSAQLGVPNLPKKSKLGSFTSEEAKLSSSFVVEQSDIDLNGHVGASVYIHWILDSAVEEGVRLDAISTLDIEYKEECFLGENIECYTQTTTGEDGGREINHLVQTQEGKILLRAKSLWH
ncbi:acyl-ACP thioesterase [Chloropicon primus]|uniref:Acyl-[acyl-carrier-protein] hydrolase n=1 Tax=Chloropicon primus TaxID=1764295 RepID=A0A5B8MLV4_9CHLO|nr:acyl-ACP thioesterase [Chloropicon primus]|eukprot:QDZ21638.1 acyl-ACP thioesterase [Chloropicon primus]